MSVRLIQRAWDTPCPCPQGKLVLLALADHTNEHTKACFPSLSAIAKRTQLSRRQVIRHIKRLVDAGIILKEKGHTGKSNRYHFPEQVVSCRVVSPMTLGSVAGVTLTGINRNGLKKTKDDTICNGDSFSSPTWKPAPKAEQLKRLKAPSDYPSQAVFDAFLEANSDLVAVHRPDLYHSLCVNKWHHWSASINKWTRIRDWKAYVLSLESMMSNH